jgi:hypothetical protein
MVRWKSAAVEAEEAMLFGREQDDEFCRVLRIAIEKGEETCPIGVITRPSTKNPRWLPRAE